MNSVIPPTEPSEPDGGPDRRHERACLVALSSLAGIGPATLHACLVFGAPSVWEALRSGRGSSVAPLVALAQHRRDPALLQRLAAEAAHLDPEAVLMRHETSGQQVMIPGDKGYPARLGDDHAPPAVLFSLGSIRPLEGPTVAIVGTRNATRLGRDTAALLASELSARNVAVVSGLALGIDGAAHEAVLAGSGPGAPVGVVATGLERSYPRRHELLHRQVASTGALVSESPIGSTPVRWRFPARNRIIAALSDAVVVVESRSAGGSMLTASEALARNIPVLAVPGHPTSAAAAGTLDLICDGAMPVRDVTDVLVAIGLGGVKPESPATVSRNPPPELGSAPMRLFEELHANPRTLGELILATSMDLSEASAALVALEQFGFVTRTGAWFERSASSPATRREAVDRCVQQ